MHFDWRGGLARVLFSLFIVFAVYNPSGRSYWHWLRDGTGHFWPKLTVGLLLLLVHAAVVATLFGTLGRKGVALVSVAVVSGWVTVAELTDVGSLSRDGLAIMPLGVISLVYAAGLSWSLIHHRLAGISHVEVLK
ncbi:hypothetical protein GXW78_07140 [Roseomonas terrae]|uniref:Uncharacterized protein n=1 Tax=Neoroseomonas terrae TaxID=424799 RepID=A0ABS5EEI8_9PROT|nr:DUF6524 family protein [Neoroseomonas terrae]MBR0649432.1 hypothetical protein [Neoroseomonas terrae]